MHPQRALGFLGEDALTALTADAMQVIGTTADPDAAMLGLLRVAESAQEHGYVDQFERTVTSIGDPDSPGTRLVHVLGVSPALGDVLARHPALLEAFTMPDPLAAPAEQIRADLLTAVQADPEAQVPVAALSGHDSRAQLRIAYYFRLLQIVSADATVSDPAALQPAISMAISDLADAALDAAVAVARAAVAGHERVRWAVIALGKTGGEELNYVSDVDVMHVVEPVDDDDQLEESALIQVGSALARELARVCSDRTREGTLWQVDANLRPEGADGPLVRTLDSYQRYYTSWAHSWEFQALLKARAVAGDRGLGEEFEGMVQPWVWQASTREGFVEEARAMRKRVVANIPSGEADLNVKLGPGGLRDVEFTVQMLQMVHGRTDDSVRSHTTITALQQLSAGGYMSRTHAEELDQDYRFLRTVEHRMQLTRLRRTQNLPTNPADQRRLARSVGMQSEEFMRAHERTQRRVRHLHEEIFYRPLLVTASQLSDGEVTLTPDDARARLAVIGYRDPGRALEHIHALTEGISRRAAIQRQLLPVLLEWFADGIDPDQGLLAFRRLSEVIGSQHWYMRLLRDSGVAARRLTMVLANSRFVADQLEAIPEAVQWLGDDAILHPLSREALGKEFLAVIARVRDTDIAQDVIRRTRRREMLRIAMAHLVGIVEVRDIGEALTNVAEAVVEAALLVAYQQIAAERDVISAQTLPLQGAEADHAEKVDERTAPVLRERRSDPARALGIEVAVLACGSFGAREMGYSSDADVQFVYVDRGAGDRAQESAIAVASHMQRILNAPAAGADMKLNADLRPEGKNGPLARSVRSWESYYRTEAATWEKQALLRTRVIVASQQVHAQLTAIMDQHRYPAGGLTESARRDIARMKARMESERLPRGAQANRHLKLGRGGMTDVEWCAQVLAFDHGDEHAQLRSPQTVEVIERAGDLGLIARSEALDLTSAWMCAWQIRRALFLWKGKEGAVVPVDHLELAAVARIVGGEDASSSALEDEYLRLSRRARLICEQIVFGRSVM